MLLARTNLFTDNNSTHSAVNNYILETANETISSQSVSAADYPPCYLTTGSRQPQQTRIGRFYDFPYDVIVTLLPYGITASGGDCTAPAGQPNMALHVQSTHDTANTPSPFTLSADNTALAMDDFNQDGFEDLFIMSQAEMLAATASDVNNRKSPMVFGAVTSLPSTSYAAQADPTVGDFNADGLKDVAWIGFDNTVHFATVCPGDVSGTICAGKQALDVLLDPQDSQAVPISATSNVFFGPWSTLVAGNFGSFEGSGLVLINPEENDPLSSIVYWFQFDTSWGLLGGTAVSVVETSPFPNPGIGHSFAIAERLDWLGQADQVVFATDWLGTGPAAEAYAMWLNIYVISFDSAQNTMSISSIEHIDPAPNPQLGLDSLDPPWLNGLAVGRFAAIGDDPSDTDFNPQIAVLRNDRRLDDDRLRRRDLVRPELVQYLPVSGARPNGLPGRQQQLQRR